VQDSVSPVLGVDWKIRICHSLNPFSPVLSLILYIRLAVCGVQGLYLPIRSHLTAW